MIRAVALAVLLLLPLTAAGQDRLTPALLDAVVKIRAEVPREARTAPFLGTEREGNGVVIDAEGLVLTIGYLVVEAGTVEVTGPSGRPIPASVVAYDNDSGFGLVRTAAPLAVKPIALGRSADAKESVTAVAAAFGHAQPVKIVSRRTFAGYWEYLLDDAIFAAPPIANWGGAALLGADGRLLGIGSLVVGDAASGSNPLPGNMYVPVDRLRGVLADLLAQGRPATPPRPWLGVNLQEAGGHLVVTRVSPDSPAARAGLARGDLILSIDGTPVRDLASLYRKLWALGPAGVEAPLGIVSNREPREVKVRTMDRHRYLRLDITY